MKKTIHVAVAVIIRSGRILIAKRPKHLHKGGYWEFPGGKVESDEAVEQALIRECQEELSISPCKFQPLMQIKHDYPEKSVLLDIWIVEDYLGVPKGLEGQPLVWCLVSELNHYQFPEANVEIVEKLRTSFDL